MTKVWNLNIKKYIPIECHFNLTAGSVQMPEKKKEGTKYIV